MHYEDIISRLKLCHYFLQTDCSAKPQQPVPGYYKQKIYMLQFFSVICIWIFLTIHGYSTQSEKPLHAEFFLVKICHFLKRILLLALSYWLCFMNFATIFLQYHLQEYNTIYKTNSLKQIYNSFIFWALHHFKNKTKYMQLQGNSEAGGKCSQCSPD